MMRRARLGRRDDHRAERRSSASATTAGRRCAAGGGGGRRRDARAVRHAARCGSRASSLDAQRRGDGRGAAQRLADELSHRRGRRRRRGEFGTGSATHPRTQDLQVLSGLPPLVREGDRFAAMLTLRNTTTREMKVRATPRRRPTCRRRRRSRSRAGDRGPAGAGRRVGAGGEEVVWPIDVPAERSASLGSIGRRHGGAKDRIKVTQLVAAPCRCACCRRRWRSSTARSRCRSRCRRTRCRRPAARPRRPARGGAAAARRRAARHARLLRDLSVHLPGAEDVEVDRPADAALWAGVADALPTYLDSDGLANYFPPRDGDPPRGSDRLTAYLLAATHEAGFAPAAGGARRDARRPGRLRRRPHRAQVLDAARRTSTCASSPRSRRCRATAGRTPKMLGSITIAPNAWPTAAVIDWLNILRASTASRIATRRLDEAQQILRARLTYAGHDAEVQHRARRLLVVADGQRRRQRRAPDPRRARRPGLEGRHAAPGASAASRASATAPG